MDAETKHLRVVCLGPDPLPEVEMIDGARSVGRWCITEEGQILTRNTAADGPSWIADTTGMPVQAIELLREMHAGCERVREFSQAVTR
jgi:hypothetical protein